jgi:hypothetical protein
VEVAEPGVGQGIYAGFIFVHQYAKCRRITAEAFMDDIPVVRSHCIAPVIQSFHLIDTAKGEKMTG